MSSSREVKICPYPFARMEVRATKFIPCCNSWLTDEFHQMEAGSDVWNGPAAQELRRRIYAGDYSLCRQSLCGVQPISLKDNYYYEAQIHTSNHHAIRTNNTHLPGPPTTLNVVADPRCNLACPSCRSEHITQLTVVQKQNMAATEDAIERHAPFLEWVSFGDGEVLFSPWGRQLIMGFDPIKFPRLRGLELKTNGLLFDEFNYRALQPGAQWIKRLMVSIDAGDEVTYDRVRGGDWQRLMSNLRWMSKLRERGQIEKFQINMTLRLDNFRSLPQLVEIGKKLNVDSVKVMSFEHWDRMGIPDYEAQAIHLPCHSQHEELYEVWNSIAREPIVNWSLNLPIKKASELTV